MNKFTKVLLLSILGCFLVAGSAMALSLSISDLTTTVLVVDEGANDQSFGTEGLLSYNTIPMPAAMNPFDGNWNITTTMGLSTPQMGSFTNPYLDLLSMAVSSQNGGTLVVILENTFDTVANLDDTITGFAFNVGGTSGGTVLFEVDINGVGVSYNTNAGAFSFNELVTPVPGLENESFNASIKATIVHTGQENSTFDAEIRAVPEPATLALFGIGLLGLAGVGRRKMN